ncbi:MAG TPA: hypothetical protein VF605_11650 [Allosphingosinicella sp.]|jgi:hypothetical protein
MSNGNAFLLAVLFIGLPALALFGLRWKRGKERSASTCGTKAHPGGTIEALAWFVGPVLSKRQGGNKSPGMPAHPAPDIPGFGFDFPIGVDLPLRSGPKVDYVTFRHGPLTGKRQIRMRYRLEKAADVDVLAVPEVDATNRYQASMTLYFQQEGDNWTASGKYEAYRWYATQNGGSVVLEAGEHELVVPLDAGWTATQTSTTASNPKGFAAAKDNACCVGFVFGGNEVGYGHGARATGPARLVVTDFRVE